MNIDATHMDDPALLRNFEQQLEDAVRRMLVKREDLSLGSIGTIELFEAIESCRKGEAARLAHELRQAYAPAPWRTPFGMGGEKYFDPTESHFLTTAGRAVLEKAGKYATRLKEPCPGNDYVFLALMEYPTSEVRTSLGERCEHYATQMRRHLGCDRVFSPRVDAYVLVTFIETTLFDCVLARLQREWRKDWWNKGIRKTVRDECENRWIREGRTLARECYFDLIFFKKIISDNWKLFEQPMRSATGMRGKEGKNKVLKWFDGVNRIRIVVMHPSKRDVEPEDIDVLRDAHRIVNQFSAYVESGLPGQ